MKLLRQLSVTLALGLLAPTLPLGAQPTPVAKLAPANLGIKLLPVQQRLGLVGKSHKTQGYFSNRSIPMIVDDINRLNILQELPPDSFVVLGGAIPATLKHGDRVELEGIFTHSTAGDPVQLRRKQVYLKLSPAAPPKVITTLPSSAVSAARISDLRQAAIKYRIPIHVFPIKPTHYALLVAGGIDYNNYFLCMYNDLVVNYNMLIGLGYDPKNIIVLNSDGSWASSSTPCGTVPVNGNATLASLTNAFNTLAGKMNAADTLYFSITTHGGSGGTICLWGETISAANFASLVGKIQKYSQMTFAMESCHSGAIIPALKGTNRIILASCDPDHNSYLTPDGKFAALNWGVVSAGSGLTPYGAPVNADGNSDGKASLAEIFNYVRGHLNSSDPNQHPHYEDNNSIDTTLPLPQGAIGTYGATKTIQ